MRWLLVESLSRAISTLRLSAFYVKIRFDTYGPVLTIVILISSDDIVPRYTECRKFVFPLNRSCLWHLA